MRKLLINVYCVQSKGFPREYRAVYAGLRDDQHEATALGRLAVTVRDHVRELRAEVRCECDIRITFVPLCDIEWTSSDCEAVSCHPLAEFDKQLFWEVFSKSQEQIEHDKKVAGQFA